MSPSELVYEVNCIFLKNLSLIASHSPTDAAQRFGVTLDDAHQAAKLNMPQIETIAKSPVLCFSATNLGKACAIVDTPATKVVPKLVAITA